MSATNDFSTYQPGLDSPCDNAAAVTPDDATDLTHVSRGLYVGVAGDVCVNLLTTGSAIVFKAVPAGTLLPLRCTRVKATSTTATNITAIW